MVDVTQAMESQYLTADAVKNAKDNAFGVITSEGKYEDTEYGNKLTLSVELNKVPKIWRPNRDSVANLANKFGRDSKLWLGKKIVFQVHKIAGKDCVIALPA